MNRYKLPASCPVCGDESPRRMSVPFVAGLAPAVEAVHLRNEKSAEEPVLMTRCQFRNTGRPLHNLHDAHDHCERDTCPSPVDQLQAGLRSHVAQDRPWLVGH